MRLGLRGLWLSALAAGCSGADGYGGTTKTHPVADGDTDTDTDADSDTDADVATDTDTGRGLGTTDSQCVPPIADVGSAYWLPPAPPIDPVGFTVRLVGLLHDGDQLSDYVDPTLGDASAELIIDLVDDVGTVLCTVTYDASANAPHSVSSLVLPYGGEVFQAWDVTVANGLTDCNQVPPSVFGSDDARALFDGFQWVVGVGRPGGLLQPYIAPYGGPYADSVFGLYVSVDGSTALDLTFAWEFAAPACPMFDPGSVLPPPTGNPLPDGLIDGQTVYRLNF